MNKKSVLGVILVLLVAGAWLAPAGWAASPRQVRAVDELWLDVSIGPPLVEWFNRTARPTDIARIDNPNQVGQLNDITTGRRMVVFRSVAEAEQRVPELPDWVEVIGYNLEHGPATPAAEQANPVASVRRMHDLAQQHGLTLALGPDHDFAVTDGPAMAPYVDIFVLQVQRVQTTPLEVRKFVAPVVPELRENNPDLQVSVQIRTEGDVDALVDLLDSLKGHLDGVSLLTSPQTVDFTKTLVSGIRRGGVARLVHSVQRIIPLWLLLLIGAFLAGALGATLAARRNRRQQIERRGAQQEEE